MWKLFEKALGRTETEEPPRDLRQSRQDSGVRSPAAENKDRSANSENGGSAPAARNDTRSGETLKNETHKEGLRNRNAEAEPAAGSTPQAAPGESQPAASPGNAAGTDPDLAELESKVKAAMRTVYDPEIPINIYELGLVYGLQIEPQGKVHVQMTLTAPSCPEAQTLPARVQQVIAEVPGVSETTVELVWEPTWTPQKMSEAARLQLGIF